ncbi:DUF2946 domain-containing protein [Roseovarius sp. EL26]|uniref:DUF2946 domain-containing protein n=1 Tax=Roseovarius sp. EL26 TaxID=2126672 RepID=UPI0020B153F6|nr:DUF2946 domain-containing protein [Roseovarius sp. EL26]
MLPRFITLITLLALTIVSTIPQGWMVNSDANGKMLLVLCTSDGAQEVWVDFGDTPPSDHDQQDELMPCPFSGIASSDIPAFAQIAALKQTPRPAPWAQSDFTHRSAGFYTRYDARGPPAFS